MPDPQTYNENELLQRAAKGDEQAFTAIFHLYRHRLFSYVCTLTESDALAEDLIQDVFFKLWNRRDTLSEVENLNSYIFRIARNQFLTHFKRMAKETVILNELEKATTPLHTLDAEDKLAVQEAEKKLQLALLQLSPQQKLVYTLSREKGLKHEEIASHLQISISTVKNHMIAALKVIREQFQTGSTTGAGMILFLAIIEAVEK